jgi:hypothetical protein
MAKRKIPEVTFPPFEFSLRHYVDDSSLFCAIYHNKAERFEELIDFLNIASRLILKHGKKVYFETISEYEFQAGEEMSEADEERLVRVLYWETHETLIYELIFVRLVENFIVFLQDIVYGILNAKGLSETDIEKEKKKLINFYAIKKFFEKLEFPLFTSKKNAAEIETIIAIRNLLVHQSGMVDTRFISRFPSLRGISGIEEVEDGLAHVQLDQQTLEKYSKTLINVVERIDKRAIKRFNILTIRDMFDSLPKE